MLTARCFVCSKDGKDENAIPFESLTEEERRENAQKRMHEVMKTVAITHDVKIVDKKSGVRRNFE